MFWGMKNHILMMKTANKWQNLEKKLAFWLKKVEWLVNVYQQFSSRFPSKIAKLRAFRGFGPGKVFSSIIYRYTVIFLKLLVASWPKPLKAFIFVCFYYVMKPGMGLGEEGRHYNLCWIIHFHPRDLLSLHSICLWYLFWVLWYMGESY